jgi:hypothetical protein
MRSTPPKTPKVGLKRETLMRIAAQWDRGGGSQGTQGIGGA